MKQQKINYIKKVNIYKPEFPLWAMILFKAIFITFIVCCAIVAVFSFIYIYTPVEGPSMLPTINSQCFDENNQLIEGTTTDSVYINRFAKATYGDIIVSRKDGKYVIKRLIAMGGDKIAIAPITNELIPSERTYKIFLIKAGKTDVEILQEPYLLDESSLYRTYEKFETYRSNNLNRFEKISVEGYGTLNFLSLKEDEIFYLGDNRIDSKDCSDYGPNTINNYVGRVDIIVYESKDNFSQIFLYFWHKIFG